MALAFTRRRFAAETTAMMGSASAVLSSSTPSNVSDPSSSATATSAAAGWTPQQRCFRHLMKSLRAAYVHDRAKLFWARHRALVEFYKYARIEDANETELLVGITNEVATFIEQYMKMDVERIVKHNEKMLKLPVDQAKKFRQEYFLAEKQHETWCKQRIKGMLERRPPPPYPFY